MHTYIHTYIHASIHAHMHTYIHTYMHAYLLACMHSYCEKLLQKKERASRNRFVVPLLSPVEKEKKSNDEGTDHLLSLADNPSKCLQTKIE
jgi:hypothetical protein